MIQSKADFIEYIDALALSASKKRPAWFGDEIAVVTRSFPEGHMTIAGVPAKKISDANSSANIARLRLLCNRE